MCIMHLLCQCYKYRGLSVVCWDYFTPCGEPIFRTKGIKMLPLPAWYLASRFFIFSPGVIDLLAPETAGA